MVVKYLDPWKDDKYAKLKGDKAESFFKVQFDEAKIYKADDSYILAGYITDYQGVVRSFKPENPITASLCAVPFYGQDYEIRSKDKDGNWKSDKITPSKFERGLYNYLLANEHIYVNNNPVFKGQITHIPNMMCAAYEGDKLTEFVRQNIELVATSESGKLVEYKVTNGSSQRRSFSGGYKGLSPEDKVAFIKKQMEEDVKSIIHKQGQCLADLTNQMIRENSDNPNFIEIYFEMLIACVR